MTRRAIRSTAGCDDAAVGAEVDPDATRRSELRFAGHAPMRPPSRTTRELLSVF